MNVRSAYQTARNVLLGRRTEAVPANDSKEGLFVGGIAFAVALIIFLDFAARGHPAVNTAVGLPLVGLYTLIIGLYSEANQLTYALRTRLHLKAAYRTQKPRHPWMYGKRPGEWIGGAIVTYVLLLPVAVSFNLFGYKEVPEVTASATAVATIAIFAQSSSRKFLRFPASNREDHNKVLRILAYEATAQNIVLYLHEAFGGPSNSLENLVVFFTVLVAYAAHNTMTAIVFEGTALAVPQRRKGHLAAIAVMVFEAALLLGVGIGVVPVLPWGSVAFAIITVLVLFASVSGKFSTALRELPTVKEAKRLATHYARFHETGDLQYLEAPRPAA